MDTISPLTPEERTSLKQKLLQGTLTASQDTCANLNRALLTIDELEERIKTLESDEGTIEARYTFLEELAKPEGYEPSGARAPEGFIAQRIERLETALREKAEFVDWLEQVAPKTMETWRTTYAQARKGEKEHAG